MTEPVAEPATGPVTGPRAASAGPQPGDTAPAQSPAQAPVGTGAASAYPGTQDSWFELLLLVLRAPDNLARHAVALALGWALAVLTLVLTWDSNPAGNLLFIIYPLLWIIHRIRRTGVLATVTFSVGLAAVDTARAPTAWVNAVADAGVSCLFSLFIGLWIWRTYEVSAQLTQALVNEQVARQALARTQAELAAAEHAAGAALERERWAREVHDTLAQGFVSVVTLSQAARSELAAGAPAAVGSRLDQLEAVARDNLAEARSLVAGEGPSALRVGDLGQALARLVDTQHRDGRRAALSVDLPDGLPRTVEVVVLRTVQEALSNVTRHSGAQEVVVSVACQSAGGLTELVITVVDDGVGAGDRPEGTGLTGMRSRVESLGGTLTVDPARAPGPQGRPGTVVEARIPL
ncbi:sensor histidine kinase [Actinomyces howellii]|uniref:sensor histidine kinase n=1 Tax=Actinomyces howellii TaxID=52771 RepID=UPI0022B2A77A|nr:sensor histidine kinase [Actinomyces howellii]